MFRLAIVLAAVHMYANPGFVAQDAIKPLPTIEVTAPSDLTVMQSLNDTMAGLGRKVNACVADGAKAETCPCRYPDDVTQLRKDYETLVKRHPDWKDQLLSYRYVNKEGRDISGTLVLQNLRRQLEVLKCGGAP